MKTEKQRLRRKARAEAARRCHRVDQPKGGAMTAIPIQARATEALKVKRTI